MTLNIDKKYTRSVNLERDISSKGISTSYIPTARALYVFDRFVKTINQEDKTRSWTLVGPYGSGKSSFGLFLSTILGESKDPQCIQARASIRRRDEDIAQRFSTATRGNTKGFLTIVLSGSPEPFAEAFINALRVGVKRFCKRGKRPKFYDRIRSWEAAPSTSVILKTIREIQDYLINRHPNCKGMLIVIDELGKFLEYEARHQTANDIFLLQALAEHAYQGSATNLYIFTLTHQSFEQYAPGLNKTQQEEWAKIQGRYENIPFVEPVEQTLEIVSKALDAPSAPSTLKKKMEKALGVLIDQQALPPHLGIKAAKEIFLKCYPLHPLTALFLPLLCQKVAQNERTLFSFIGSDEPFGLTDCVHRQKKSQLVNIHSIYDYFIENQTANILDHYTHRRWAEVTSALSRLGEAPAEEIAVLKTIGLINIIGSQGGVKASQEILSVSTQLTAKQLNETIKKLKKKSLIQYRKFNDEYRVWQGSDFDIEEALAQEVDQLRSISLSEHLNRHRHIPNIVANRHSIKRGTFRFFSPFFVEESNQAVPKSGHPKLLIYIAKKGEDSSRILDSVKASSLDVVGIFFEHGKIKNAVTEVTALQQILANRNELNSDPVAMHEFKDRIITAKENLNSLLYSITQQPEKGTWFWESQKLDISCKRDFNSSLSDVLSDVFRRAPVIKNELINQDVPSAQAATARNKLMQAMLTCEHLEDLGIQRYPAEKAIYKATLRATGLHQENGGRWKLGPPPEEDDFNMRAAWDCIVEFLQDTQHAHKPFTSLNRVLQAEPYGIKEGVLPILYLAVFIHFKHELALYENGSYLPVLPPERYDIFIKRMDLFSVQLIKIEGINRSLYDSYADLFRIQEADNLQALVKPFALFITSLPEYVKNTRLLSPRSRDIVTAYDRATSPEDLLFNLLPKACSIEELTESSVEAFSASFREGLVEIRDSYDELLRNLSKDVSSAFSAGTSDLKKLRNKLGSRFAHLLPHVNGSSQISSALRFLTATKGSDKDWLERLLASLIQKRCTAWKDSDTSRAKTELRRVASSIIDIEKIYLDCAEDGEASKANDKILLKTVRPVGENDSIVHFDDASLKKTQKARSEILDILNSIDSDSLRLTALAGIVDEVLSKKDI